MKLDQTLEWANLLKELRAIAPDAHIAGGAVRDWLLERPIRDVDVFVNANASEHKISKVVRGYRPEFGRTVGDEYLTSDRSVVESTEWRDPNDVLPPINIIRRIGNAAPIRMNLVRFDLGLCRVSFDGEEIRTTSAFRHDVRARAMTLRKCENGDQYEQTLRRVARLQEKYEGWSFTVPEEFAHFPAAKKKLEDDLAELDFG